MLAPIPMALHSLLLTGGVTPLRVVLGHLKTFAVSSETLTNKHPNTHKVGQKRKKIGGKVNIKAFAKKCWKSVHS